jgi:Tfp pilus assembly protein PilV
MSKVKSQKAVACPAVSSSAKGFSLIECVIALIILMVVALSIGSVLRFSQASSENARKRFASLLVAQHRMEDVRNTAFADLAAGTVTETDYMYDGIPFTVTRTITHTDVIANTVTAPGPETKLIIVEVNPKGSSLASDKVRLTTVRGVNRPGPNKTPNPSTP